MDPVLSKLASEAPYVAVLVLFVVALLGMVRLVLLDYQRALRDYLGKMLDILVKLDERTEACLGDRR